MAAGDPSDKNWGLVALMVILIVAVFVMVFLSFKWSRPGGRYSDQQTAPTTNSQVNITLTPPPVASSPAQ